MKPSNKNFNDRLPPHSNEAEQGVLGCCLLDPSALDAVMRKSSDDAGLFYDLRHQTIFESLTLMRGEMKPSSDMIAVQQHLKERKTLDQIGGIAYLSQLQDSVPSAANVDYYLEILEEKYLMRKTIALCSKTISGIYDCTTSAEEFVDKFESDAMTLRRISKNETKPIRDLVNEALVDIEAMFTNQGKITGISTGLIDLDLATDGLHPGEFIILAAYPSVGKTSLAMNIVESAALDHGLPVGVFSAEMTGRSLVRRSLASNARVNMRNIRQGKMAESDFPKLTVAAAKLSNSKLHIDDSSDLTIAQVRARARRMKQRYGIKLFVADYAQLFSSPNAENRTNELDQVSKGFKAMAKELDVPVILLSQLNDDGKLKGARAFGEDADGVWKLSRAEEQEDENGDGERINLLLDKQRNEQRGIVIPLTFLKPYTRFESAPKFSDTEY